MTGDSVESTRASGAAWRIAGIYAILAGIWIFLSDRALASMVSADTLARLTHFQTLKGLFFVLATASLLWLAVDRHTRAMERAAVRTRRIDAEYRQLVEQAEEGVWALDAAGMTTFANQRLEEMLGTDRLLGRPALDFAAGVSVEALSDLLMHCGNGERLTVEMPLRRADGVAVEARLVAGPAPRDAHGVGMLMMVTDLTERRSAETARRQSERRLASFLANMPGLAFVKGADGRYVMVEGAAKRDLPDSVLLRVGATAEELWPDLAATIAQGDAAALANGRSDPYMLVIATKLGIRHWMNVKFRMDDGSGEAVLGGLSIDLTDQIEARAALAESEARYRALATELERRVEDRTAELRAAKDDIESLLHLMTHGVGSSLRGLEEFGRTLARTQDGAMNDIGREATMRIVGAAARAGRMMQELMEFGRSGAHPPEPVSLALVAHEVVGRLERERAGLRVHLHGPLPMVLGHRVMLAEVLFCLLDDAAGSDGADIELTTHRIDDWVRLLVSRPEGRGDEPPVVRRGVERMNGRFGLDHDPAGKPMAWIELEVAGEG